MAYIHDRKNWPILTWSPERLAGQLAGVRHRQGRLIGRLEGLGFSLRNEAELQTLTEDVLKSSEIEGEHLDKDQVRSSIARRLGLDIGGLSPVDRQVEGIVEMMLDAVEHYADPMTEERLFGWHSALFPTGRSGMTKIVVGRWRDAKSDPMQVVSGPIGREKVHYQAPNANRVPKEMRAFLKLTSSKWAKLAKCSQDTALRDIDDLVKGGVLVKEAGGGRSTSYALADRWIR